MPCLLALFALALPRVVLLLVAIFSNYIGRAYENVLWPILGFFFMPLTTLAYAFGINTAGSIRGFYLVIVVLAVLLDLGFVGGASRRRKWWKRKR